MYIPPHLSPVQNRNYLRKQVALGRYMLLGSVIFTALELILLICNSHLYFNYSIALAYYPVWLGKGFDNGFGPLPWTAGGTGLLLGLLVSLLILGLYILIWQLSKTSNRWLKVGMGLLTLDGLLLVIFNLCFLDSAMQCLLELVIHGAAIYEMYRALEAVRILTHIRRKEQIAAARAAEGTD